MLGRALGWPGSLWVPQVMAPCQALRGSPGYNGASTRPQPRPGFAGRDAGPLAGPGGDGDGGSVGNMGVCFAEEVARMAGGLGRACATGAQARPGLGWGGCKRSCGQWSDVGWGGGARAHLLVCLQPLNQQRCVTQLLCDIHWCVGRHPSAWQLRATQKQAGLRVPTWGQAGLPTGCSSPAPGPRATAPTLKLL